MKEHCTASPNSTSCYSSNSLRRPVFPQLSLSLLSPNTNPRIFISILYPSFNESDFLWICVSLVYCGELLLSLYLYISIASLSIDQSNCLSSLLIPPRSHLLPHRHNLSLDIFTNNKLLSIYLH